MDTSAIEPHNFVGNHAPRTLGALPALLWTTTIRMNFPVVATKVQGLQVASKRLASGVLFLPQVYNSS
jgi:hypothetical protein